MGSNPIVSTIAFRIFLFIKKVGYRQNRNPYVLYTLAWQAISMEDYMEINQKHNKSLINSVCNTIVGALLEQEMISREDLSSLGAHVGYLFTKEDGELEGLFRVSTDNDTFYFALQNGGLIPIDIDDNMYDATISKMEEMHPCLLNDDLPETEAQKARREKNNKIISDMDITTSDKLMTHWEDSEIELRDEDIKMDVYRSSGAGGQKVNKTSSAVRLTHIPTGIVVASQVERSHFQNLENCKNMLRARLAEIKEREHLEKISDIKGVQMKIEWGSQIRSYVFMPYQLVKDHRTNFEDGNIDNVMDGDLDGFINAYLTMKADENDGKS